MKQSITIFFKLLFFSVIGLSLNLNINTINAQEKPVRFICKNTQELKIKERIPTTVITHIRGIIPIIYWQTKGSNYEQVREYCQKVSQRFQRAYDNNTLKYIIASRLNQQIFICSALEVKGQCNTVLMEVNSQAEAEKIIHHLTNSQQGVNTPPLYYKINFQGVIERTETIEDIMREINQS